MKEKKKLFVLILIFSMIHFSSVLSVLNLGSLSSVSHLVLNKGEEGIFKLSFFTLGEEPVHLSIDSEHAEELKVMIVPKELTLKREVTKTPYPCEDCGWFVLKDGETYAKTTPVYVYVRVPEKITRNLYRIKVTATATSSEPPSSGSGIRQSLVQAREFVLTISVPGDVFRPTETTNLTVERMKIEKIESNVSGRRVSNESERRISLPTGFITLSKEQEQTVWVGFLVFLVGTAIIILVKKMLM